MTISIPRRRNWEVTEPVILFDYPYVIDTKEVHLRINLAPGERALADAGVYGRFVPAPGGEVGQIVALVHRADGQRGAGQSMTAISLASVPRSPLIEAMLLRG